MAREARWSDASGGMDDQYEGSGVDLGAAPAPPSPAETPGEAAGSQAPPADAGDESPDRQFPVPPVPPPPAAGPIFSLAGGGGGGASGFAPPGPRSPPRPARPPCRAPRRPASAPARQSRPAVLLLLPSYPQGWAASRVARQRTNCHEFWP